MESVFWYLKNTCKKSPAFCWKLGSRLMFIKTIKRKKTSFFHQPFVCWETNFHNNVSFTLFSHFFPQPKKRNTFTPTTFFVFFSGASVASSLQPNQRWVSNHNPSTATVERGACWLDLRGNGAAALATPRRALDTFVVSGLDVLTGEGYLVAPRIRQGLVRFYKGYMIHGFMKESRNNDWG